jgi:hypothetical protein
MGTSSGIYEIPISDAVRTSAVQIEERNAAEDMRTWKEKNYDLLGKKMRS